VKPECIPEELLAAFADGQLDESARASIEEHLADCAECCVVLTRVTGAVSSPPVPSSQRRGADVDTSELPPGTRVGRYVIELAVGRGAMGAVYAAVDPDLNRKVAVKVLRADAMPDIARQKMRARLLREAQAMARLSHPEVITVYDVGSFGEQLFVAMEYVEGETLRLWRSARPRTYSDIVAVYERAGRGLAAAHEAGLVHRDFKPDNVLVARDGRVRVTDFGLARSIDRTTAGVEMDSARLENSESGGLAMSLTRTGALLGTPAYMAPEQLRGGAADARSDVFSFCVAFYEALYGKRPFEGRTIAALQAAIEEGAVRRAPVISRVPSWLRHLLLRGLRSAPDKRFASMRELLAALQVAERASRQRWVRAVGVLGASLAVVIVVARFERSKSSLAAGSGNAREPPPPSYQVERPPVPPASEPPLDVGVAPAESATTSTPPLPAQAPAALDKAASHRAPAPIASQPTTTAPLASSAKLPFEPHRPLIGNNGALILE
jgi:serine/threonine protein kinase